MEIDKKRLHEFIETVVESLRKADSELLVNRYVLYLLRKNGFIPDVLWEQMIAAARENPTLKSTMSQKYDGLLADLLRAIDEVEFQSKVSEWLKQWKPETPPN